MKLRSLSLLMLAGFLRLPDVVAQDDLPPAAVPFQIAVVDMVRAFELHPHTDDAVKELTKKRDDSRKEFSDLNSKLKLLLQKHQEYIRAQKKEEAENALKEANELEKAIATLGTKGARDLEEEFRNSKQQILDDIKKAVQKFNEAGTFHLILDSSSNSSNGLPQVIDARGATDITDEVVAFIRKQVSESKQ